MKKNIIITAISALIITAIVQLSLTGAETKREFKPQHESLHENGKSCTACHETEKGQYVPDYNVCIGCHGDGEDMAEATSELDPNPHISNHYGTDVDCTACHSEHGKSVAVCTRCHSFEYPGLK